VWEKSPHAWEMRGPSPPLPSSKDAVSRGGSAVDARESAASGTAEAAGRGSSGSGEPYLPAAADATRTLSPGGGGGGGELEEGVEGDGSDASLYFSP
jgi:hypothetical protein